MKHIFGKMSQLAAVLGLVMFVPWAQASLLVEPYVGYDTGTYGVGSTTPHTESGVGFGARLGYENLGLMVGGEYMTGSWSIATTPSASATPTDIGAFIGYNFPMLLRVYGEYIVSAEQKISFSSASDTMQGSGIKLGIGYTMLPLVSINLEYMSHTYTKDDSGTLNTSVKNSMYGLTISVPLTL